jgi:hypothetical protein
MSKQPANFPDRAENQRQALLKMEIDRRKGIRRAFWFSTPLCGLGSYVMFSKLVDALQTGIVTHPRSRLASAVVNVSSDPFYYWCIVALVGLCAFLMLSIAAGGLWVLLRQHNHSP